MIKGNIYERIIKKVSNYVLSTLNRLFSRSMPYDKPANSDLRFEI